MNQRPAASRYRSASTTPLTRRVSTVPLAGTETENTIDDRVRLALDKDDVDRAVAILAEAYYGDIQRVAAGLCRDRAMADDVTQTTFIEALGSIRKFRGRSSLRTWLVSIARHRAIDALRRMGRECRRGDDTGSLDVADAGPLPDASLDVGTWKWAIDQCLRELPSDVRLPLLMRYEQDLSFRDIGRLLRERPSTMQARVARALPKLRRSLRARGLEPRLCA